MKIICVHLLNDYSGSPLILSEVIKVLNNREMDVLLLVASPGEGFLSALPCPTQTYKYKRSKSITKTFFSYFYSQFLLGRIILKHHQCRNTILYVNTMLPFGAALVGKLLGFKIIYHIHETSLTPRIFKSLLRIIVKITSHHVIFVSHYLAEVERIAGARNSVVYNAPSDSCIADSKDYVACHLNDGKFNVLMVCSLRKYKGIEEFLNLADILKGFNHIYFNLVLNASEEDITNELNIRVTMPNLSIYPSSNHIEEWYKKSSLLLNLSRPDEWIETFGMTILEAMTFGIPVIGPDIGGPTEIIANGVSGYCISSKNISAIAEKIEKLSCDEELWKFLSNNAKKKSSQFLKNNFSESILNIISLLSRNC